MPGSIVVFSGMDGAGKSTQIEQLRERFVDAGKNCTTFWSRGGYTPGINLIKSLARRGSGDRLVPAAGPSSKRDQAFSRPMVRTLWLTLAVLDLMLFYGGWLRWKRLMGHHVICDRYLDDTRLDFAINFPQADVPNWWLWKVLERVATVPDHQFLLLIPVDESQRRSKLKNEPFPDSPEVLKARLEEYESWLADASWHHIDGQRPLEEIASKIESIVETGGSRRSATVHKAATTS